TLSDHAILVLTPDDRTVLRRKRSPAPRDNVVFELGLFMGCLGRRRASYVLCEVRGKTPRLATDLLGTNAPRVRWDGRRCPLGAAVAPACRELLDAIVQRSRETELRMLPATALAVGYFRNFVLEVCRALMDERRFVVGGRTYDLSRDIFDFVIVLPDSLEQASHVGLRDLKLRGQLRHCLIRRGSREFPFFVKTAVQGGRVVFYDMPTILKASAAVVELIAPGGTAGRSEERRLLEARELYNFRLTVQHLLETDGDAVD